MSNLLETDKLQVVWGFINDCNSTTESAFWEKLLKMQKQEYRPEYSKELDEKVLEEEERENERRIAEYNKYVDKVKKCPFQVKSAKEEEIEKEQVGFFIRDVLDEALEEYETEFWSNFERKFVHMDIQTETGSLREENIPDQKTETQDLYRMPQYTVDRSLKHQLESSCKNIFERNLQDTQVTSDDRFLHIETYAISSNGSFYENGRSLYTDAPGFESLKGKGKDIGGGARLLWSRPGIIGQTEEKPSFMAEILKGIMESKRLEEARKTDEEAQKKREAKLRKHGVKFLFKEARQRENRLRLEKETSEDITPKKKRIGISRIFQSMVACFSRKRK